MLRVMGNLNDWFYFFFSSSNGNYWKNLVIDQAFRFVAFIRHYPRFESSQHLTLSCLTAPIRLGENLTRIESRMFLTSTIYFLNKLHIAFLDRLYSQYDFTEKNGGA